jgi:hypothetical protein
MSRSDILDILVAGSQLFGWRLKATGDGFASTMFKVIAVAPDNFFSAAVAVGAAYELVKMGV